jgi:hypothetical protein
VVTNEYVQGFAHFFPILCILFSSFLFSIIQRQHERISQEKHGGALHPGIGSETSPMAVRQFSG